MELNDSKSHKKSKKARKEAKKQEHNLKLKTLKRKQTEVARVLQLKTALILQNALPYLEYIELREELVRLRSLQENFNQEAALLALESS